LAHAEKLKVGGVFHQKPTHVKTTRNPTAEKIVEKKGHPSLLTKKTSARVMRGGGALQRQASEFSREGTSN